MHRILLWTLFSEIALKAQVVFIEQANSKEVISRGMLPLVVVGSGLVSCDCRSNICRLSRLDGLLPGLVSLALLPIIALTAWFAIALGLWLGLNVFFRTLVISSPGTAVLVLADPYVTPHPYCRIVHRN